MKPLEFALNSADKNMLACERPGFAFNSHLVIDFEAPLDEDRLRSTTERFFSQVPFVRTLIRDGKRVVLPHPILNNVLRIQEVSEQIEKDFYDLPFDLTKEHPFRMLYGKLLGEENTWRFVMSVHHSSFDGVAQSYLLREFMKVYQGQTPSEWAMTITAFRYRNIFKHLGPKRAVGLAMDLCSNLIMKPKKKSLTLLKDPAHKSRRCRYELIEVPADCLKLLNFEAREMGINFFERISIGVLKVLNQLVAPDGTKPYSLTIPVNIRTSLRVDRYFQNVLGVARVYFTREEIEAADFPQNFHQKLKDSSNLGHILMLLATLGFFAKLVGLKKLGQIVQKMDEDPEYIYGSALVTSIRLPLSLDMSQFKIKRLFGHGKMFKSPGMGIVLTGTKDKPIIVLEYLEDLFAAEDIEKFKLALRSELGIRN